jgi:hypothetical protein
VLARQSIRGELQTFRPLPERTNRRSAPLWSALFCSATKAATSALSGPRCVSKFAAALRRIDKVNEEG